MLRALETLGEVHRAMSTASSSSSSLSPASVAADSPYLTPPRSQGSASFTPRSTRSTTRARVAAHDGSSEGPKQTKRDGTRRSERVKRGSLPPTPESSSTSRTGVADHETPLKSKKRRKVVEVVIPLPPSSISPKTPRKKAKRKKEARTVLAKSETGKVEPMEKIWLIQERVRHDPWKLLVATTLLNVTSGRAARPVYIEILRRWSTPHALADTEMKDLVDVLYPIGLFIQRANSLKTLSQQYLDWGWPIIPSIAACNPYKDPPPSLPLYTPPQLPEMLDVNPFRGAGRYASDSFRIYSHLLPGRGGPDRETRWVEKRIRGLERYRTAQQGNGGGAGDGVVDVQEVGGYLSDEEGVGVEEWRIVRPTDKELRRYLIWRWGIEGIVYDIIHGPRITRERDRQRLKWMIEDEE